MPRNAIVAKRFVAATVILIKTIRTDDIRTFIIPHNYRLQLFYILQADYKHHLNRTGYTKLIVTCLKFIYVAIHM